VVLHRHYFSSSINTSAYKKKIGDISEILKIADLKNSYKKIGNPDTLGYSNPTPFQKNSPKI